MTTTTNSPGPGAMIGVEGVSKSFGETKESAASVVAKLLGSAARSEFAGHAEKKAWVSQ